MALSDQFFGQVGDDPLGATVEFRRNTFKKRSNLCDSHGSSLGCEERASNFRSAAGY